MLLLRAQARHSRRVRIFLPRNKGCTDAKNLTRGRAQIAAGSRTVLEIGLGRQSATYVKGYPVLRRGNWKHLLALSNQVTGKLNLL